MIDKLVQLIYIGRAIFNILHSRVDFVFLLQALHVLNFSNLGGALVLLSLGLFRRALVSHLHALSVGMSAVDSVTVLQRGR